MFKMGGDVTPGITIMRKIDLRRRRKQSAAIARMFLVCSRAFNNSYSRNKNVAAVMPELLVAATIRLKDERRTAPCSINGISQATGLPRPNVRRYLKELVRQGLVTTSGSGYVGNDDYLQKNFNARYFKQMVAAILRAAAELKRMS
jgi:hypothetical protein